MTLAEQVKLAAELSPLVQLRKEAMKPSETQKLMEEVQKVLSANPMESLKFLARAVEEQNKMTVPKTDFELAMERLKANVATMPKGFEFEIPQVIGADVWAELDRSSKLALGKHVKASQDAYGLEFLRKSVSNHAIYKRAD